MKKLTILTLLLALGLSNAVAQSGTKQRLMAEASAKRIVYVGGTADKTKGLVVGSNGKKFNFASPIRFIGANSQGVWTMDYKKLYRNGVLVKDYNYFRMDGRTEQNKYLVSAAMRVRDDKVAVCGVYEYNYDYPKYATDATKKEYLMFGEINQKEVFRTKWESKRYNYTSTSNKGSKYALMYEVRACDVDGGKIYATGYSHRKYTEGALKLQKVRQCARVWCNGETIVEQFQNRTCHAYSLDVVYNNGKREYHTAGDQRGEAWAWVDNNDVLKTGKKGAIWGSTTLLVDNKPQDFYLFEGALYDSSFNPIYKNSSRYIYDVVNDGYRIFFVAAINGSGEAIVYAYNPRSKKLEEYFHAEGFDKSLPQLRLAVY